MVPRFRFAHLPGPARFLATALLGGCLLAGAGAGPARANEKLEGYYEAEVSAQKDDGKWHFGSPGANGMPKHYAELRFWSWPSDRFELFAKVRAEANRDDDRTATVDYYNPPWYSGEGHIKLRQNKYEAYLFYRQNRFYINDEPLLRLVDDNKLKNDDWGPKAQGVRFDFWESNVLGIPNLGGTFITSDNGGTYNPGTGDVANGDNSWIMRLRHKAWDGRIESGAMYVRKDWTDTSREDWPNYLDLMHNDVYSVDLAFSPRELVPTGLRLGPVDLEQSRWTVEAALSQVPYEEEIFATPTGKARAIATEVRDIHFGDLTAHGWYNDFGEDFRNYSSSRFDDNREYNRVQKHAELIWLVPGKAVTAKLNYDNYRKRMVTEDEPDGGLRPAREYYAELYMEYINGFKSRFAYRNWRGYDADASVSDFQTYPDWFGEITVENFLAKIRIQGRIHDAGTFRQVTAYGFDMSVNLTERLKGYLRALNVNEETEARHTLFAQLKYDIGWGSEVYFEYGDAGQSDNLVYTDWFVNEGNNDNLRDRFKLLVKAWF
ncbi:hypothetical protein KDM41_07220 [bacterium]|nr:hypothetical protein [bacterium]